jgi:hypothetical protein
LLYQGQIASPTVINALSAAPKPGIGMGNDEINARIGFTCFQTSQKLPGNGNPPPAAAAGTGAAAISALTCALNSFKAFCDKAIVNLQVGITHDLTLGINTNYLQLQKLSADVVRAPGEVDSRPSTLWVHFLIEIQLQA